MRSTRGVLLREGRGGKRTPSERRKGEEGTASSKGRTVEGAGAEAGERDGQQQVQQPYSRAEERRIGVKHMRQVCGTGGRVRWTHHMR